MNKMGILFIKMPFLFNIFIKTDEENKMQDMTNPFLNFIAKTSLFFAAISVFALVNMLFYGAFMRLVFNAVLPYLNLDIIIGFAVIIGFLSLGGWLYRGRTNNTGMFRVVITIASLILAALAILYSFKSFTLIDFSSLSFFKEAIFYQMMGLITSSIFLFSSALMQLTATTSRNNNRKTSTEFRV